VETRHFRLYWLALNTAYVMEFFMQTLVKKGHIGQRRMLRMNQFLMGVSSIAAVRVLGGGGSVGRGRGSLSSDSGRVLSDVPLISGVGAGVCVPAAMLSVALNLVHAGHELTNTALVAAVAMSLCGGGGGGGGDGGGGSDGGSSGGCGGDRSGLAVFIALSAAPLLWLEGWTRRVIQRGARGRSTVAASIREKQS